MAVPNFYPTNHTDIDVKELKSLIMNIRALPKPSDVLEAWWKEVLKKIGNSTVFIDDIMSESLHWYGGLNRINKSKPYCIKSFSSFEECDSTASVFFVSSPIHDITEQILKDIVSNSQLNSVVLICGAHPSSLAYVKYPSRDDTDDKRVLEEVETKIYDWMDCQNASVQIYHYPLLLLPIAEDIFMLPKFNKIYPILESDVLDIMQDFNLNKPGEPKFIDEIGRLEFGHLPYNLRVNIRHLITFFHNLFQAMNVREEIFSLGHTSGIIASELDSFNPARLRRRTAEGKVSLVLIDRTLDLVAPCSSKNESFFDKIIKTLPRLPGHLVDSRINMSPLTDAHPDCGWTILPGCFCHRDDQSRQYLEKAMFENETSVLKYIHQRTKDILKDDTDISNEELLQKLKDFASNKENLITHINFIQQILGTIEVQSKNHLQYEQLFRFEKILLQSVCGGGDTLNEIVSLIESRHESELTLDDILYLMVCVCSLSGEMTTDSNKYKFIDPLSKAIQEDKDHLPPLINEITSGDIDDLSAMKTAHKIWRKLHGISTARKHLKKYQNLHTETTEQILGSYESLLPQVITDCIQGSTNEDLEYKSSGLKNMIKSGFSLFVNVSKPCPKEAEMMIIYIVGGVTSSELAKMRNIIQDEKPLCNVVVGSSHFTHQKDQVEYLFLNRHYQ